MSVQINTAFVQQFTNNVTHLAQQEGTRLRAAVRNESITGKRAAFEQIGPTTLQARTTRHGDTPIISTPHSRRWVTTTYFEGADLVDDADKVRMLIDPASDYVRAFGMAGGRTIDDTIISAFTATATTGEDADSTAAFDTANFQIAAGGTGMSLAKWLEAKEKLDAAENDGDYFLVVHARQLRDLLGETELTSADFNTVRALVAGEINQFLGTNVIRVERLPVSGTERSCYMWDRRKMLVALGREPQGRISERDDKSYSVQAYYKLDVGATRMEETGVVEILCDEA